MMRLFINNSPLYLIKPKQLPARFSYDKILNNAEEITAENLKGTILIKNVDFLHIDRLLELHETTNYDLLNMAVLLTDEYKSVRAYLKSKFKVIEAGGGLVLKQDKILMIYRLGKWDLPKGKADKGEDLGDAAVREVQEECGVIAELNKRLCVTWHNYRVNGSRVLKKSVWYQMRCLNDDNLSPQIEEDITEIRWVSLAEAQELLKNSYPSIKEVIKMYELCR